MGFLKEETFHIVKNIWDSILGLEIEPIEDALLNTNQHMLTGYIFIFGAWDGALSLDCSKKFADQASSIMFDIPASQLKMEDIQDTMGELANMLGGNIKSLLPQPCKLSLPSVVDGFDYRVNIPGSQCISTVSFKSQREPLRISLFKKMEIS